jgi:flagellar motor switch protein FliM
LPSELVVLVRFDVAIGDVRGPMICCIPRSAIDRFGEQIAGAAARAAPGHQRQTSGRSKIATVELVTELAHVRIPNSELVGLRVGDIITTETAVRSPLVIAVDGMPKFHARPGAYKGRKAVSIERRIGSPESAT